MYKNVKAQIILSGLSRKDLAQKLGIQYNTLNHKLSGKSVFTLDEAMAIKRILGSNIPIEQLFEKGA